MIILDRVPLWAVYFGTVVIALLVAEVGYRIGMWQQRRDPSALESPLTGIVVGGMLGLMAFLLAFTIGIAISQHNNRKAMVVSEANAIGTAYLRAGLIGDSVRDASRDLMRQYVDLRLAVQSDPTQLESVLAHSEEIHSELWAIVEENIRQGSDPEILALYVESINDVIDVHSLRLAAITLRLPQLLGAVMYATIILSFLLVGIASSSDGKRHLVPILLLALSFVAVLIIIVDLDRPQEGLLNVNQAALYDLLQQMKSSTP